MDYTSIIDPSQLDIPNIINHISSSIKEDSMDNRDDDLEYDDYIHPFEEENEEENDDEEYPTVFYNLQAAPHSDCTKRNEALKERQQIIQQKKQEKLEQEKQLQQRLQDFHVKDEPEGHRIFLKKVKRLVPYSTIVKGYCYVPGQNLIFIIINDSTKVVIYSTLSFKAVKYIKFAKPIRIVRYLEDYDKVVFGGEDFFVQTFNLCTFKTGLQTDLDQHAHVDEIVYLKRNNVIGVASCHKVLYILSKSLVCLYHFDHPSSGPIKDIISLTSEIILTTCLSDNKKSLYLCNLKTRTIDICDGITVKEGSCLDVTKKVTLTTITCVASLSDKLITNPVSNRLVQFALDAQSNKLVLRRIGPENREFVKLNKIQNSEYFVATLRYKKNLKILLMKRCDDNFEILKNIIAPNCLTQNVLPLIWLDQPSFMIGTDQQASISVYKILRKDKIKASNQ